MLCGHPRPLPAPRFGVRPRDAAALHRVGPLGSPGRLPSHPPTCRITHELTMGRLTFGVLLVGTVFTAPASGGAPQKEIENVAAFARLYGVVRYFYPSDA